MYVVIPGLLILAFSAGAVLYGCRHRFHPLDWLLSVAACALLGPLVVGLVTK